MSDAQPSDVLGRLKSVRRAPAAIPVARVPITTPRSQTTALESIRSITAGIIQQGEGR